LPAISPLPALPQAGLLYRYRLRGNAPPDTCAWLWHRATGANLIGGTLVYAALFVQLAA
jgi:hypothetical protein